MAEPRFGALKNLRQQAGTAVAELPEEASAGEVQMDGDAPLRRRPGRPEGKRSNPNYERMNLIVRKDTRRKVDLKMLQDGIEEDLSELVDRLLREWAG